MEKDYDFDTSEPVYVAAMLVGYYEDVHVEIIGVYTTYEKAKEQQDYICKDREDCRPVKISGWIMDVDQRPYYPS